MTFVNFPRKVVGKDPWERDSRPVPVVPDPHVTEANVVDSLQEPSLISPMEDQPVVDTELPVTDAEFEEMVEQALESIPAELSQMVENCAFIVEDEPQRGRATLLGLYHGRPLTTRQDYSGALPDTITIYQGPLVRHYPDREELRRQVRRTVIHEIGHYFGFEEEELHELGWG